MFVFYVHKFALNVFLRFKEITALYSGPSFYIYGVLFKVY